MDFLSAVWLPEQASRRDSKQKMGQLSPCLHLQILSNEERQHIFCPVLIALSCILYTGGIVIFFLSSLTKQPIGPSRQGDVIEGTGLLLDGIEAWKEEWAFSMVVQGASPDGPQQHSRRTLTMDNTNGWGRLWEGGQFLRELEENNQLPIS